jgi:hydroxymethylglutaryl-CoA lyase
LGAIPLRCHLHNTRNTGLANAQAAIDAGAISIDASIGGIGGCPFAPAATGNIPTDDLLYMLNGSGMATSFLRWSSCFQRRPLRSVFRRMS